MTRARRAFWILVGVAIAATGALSRALAWRPSPAAGLAVAVAATGAVLAAGLALRIVLKTQAGPAAAPAQIGADRPAEDDRGPGDHPAR